MKTTKCTDPVVLNLWHPIGAIDETPTGIVVETVLLEERVSLAKAADDAVAVWRSRPDLRAGDTVEIASIADRLPAKLAYGYVWTSLGSPPQAERILVYPQCLPRAV